MAETKGVDGASHRATEGGGVIGVVIRCDDIRCIGEIRDFGRHSSKTDLKKYARRIGWQVGKDKHYCPQHRTVKHTPVTGRGG